jgi:ABC-type amino acid transport substrate-binding protein
MPPDQIFSEIAQGKYDVVLGDFSVLHRRVDLVLFSRPIYISKVGVVRKSKNSIFNLITNKILVTLFSLILILILIYTIIYKLITKDTLLNSFYETFVNFFVNMREIFPKRSTKYFSKTTMKILHALWTVLRYLFYTIVISQFIRIFINASDFITPEELSSVKEILVQKGSSFVDFVKKMDKIPIEIDTTKEIIDILNKSNKIEYWYHDLFTIKQGINKNAPNLTITSTKNNLRLDECAIAVSKNRPDILKMIDDVILELQDNDKITKICSSYFDNQEDITGCKI